MYLTTFTEVQKFSAWPLILLIAIVAFILIKGFFSIVTERGSTRIVLILVFLIPVLILVLTFCMHLDTRVDTSGIYYRFYPIHRSEHKIEWKDVDSAYVRTYAPLAEYGGWGIRNGHNGKAYNTSGNRGLQIVFKDGHRLLLGTQKPDEVKVVINTYAPASVKRGYYYSAP